MGESLRGRHTFEIADRGAGEEQRAPGMRLLSLLCLVASLEGADAVLLPCVFYALQRDLHLTLNNLALMSMVQALGANLAAPFWGIMADRGTMKRKSIITLGCVLQGLITVVLAGVDQMWPMLVLRALNGVMLASLKPIACGIIADVTAETKRGKVYGGMGFATHMGTMGGTFIATNLARRRVLGLQGWRVAFAVVGSLSVLVGFVARALMREPPRRGAGGDGASEGKGRGFRAVGAELGELAGYFRIPSFGVIILQGCFGNVPWNALGYKTLFFQLGGISDFQASLIDVFSQLAGSVGHLLGGAIGDRLSRCSRHHGRPLTAQISVLAGIPVAWFVFMVRPPPESALAYYSTLMVFLGLTATWCLGATNLPILSQIVREDRRATIMAWEGSLETSFSAIFGNAMVGFLAQNVFGYDLKHARARAGEADVENTRALGSALMLVSFVPWLLCFACYSLLHWSYPRDLRRLEACEQQRRSKKTTPTADDDDDDDDDAAREPAN